MLRAMTPARRLKIREEQMVLAAVAIPAVATLGVVTPAVVEAPTGDGT